MVGVVVVCVCVCVTGVCVYGGCGGVCVCVCVRAALLGALDLHVFTTTFQKRVLSKGTIVMGAYKTLSELFAKSECAIYGNVLDKNHSIL